MVKKLLLVMLLGSVMVQASDMKIDLPSDINLLDQLIHSFRLSRSFNFFNLGPSFEKGQRCEVMRQRCMIMRVLDVCGKAIDDSVAQEKMEELLNRFMQIYDCNEKGFSNKNGRSIIDFECPNNLQNLVFWKLSEWQDGRLPKETKDLE